MIEEIQYIYIYIYIQYIDFYIYNANYTVLLTYKLTLSNVFYVNRDHLYQDAHCWTQNYSNNLFSHNRSLFLKVLYISVFYRDSIPPLCKISRNIVIWIFWYLAFAVSGSKLRSKYLSWNWCLFVVPCHHVLWLLCPLVPRKYSRTTFCAALTTPFSLNSQCKSLFYTILLKIWPFTIFCLFLVPYRP